MVWGLPKTFGHCENPGHPQVMLYQISCHSWARPINPSLHRNPHSAPQRTLPHRGLWCQDSTRRRPQSPADPGWIWLDPAVPGLVPTRPCLWCWLCCELRCEVRRTVALGQGRTWSNTLEISCELMSCTNIQWCLYVCFIIEYICTQYHK